MSEHTAENDDMPSRYTPEQKARVNEVLDRYLGKKRKRPTKAQIERASDVLMWLSMECDDGALRDHIAVVRHELELRCSPGVSS